MEHKCGIWIQVSVNQRAIGDEDNSVLNMTGPFSVVPRCCRTGRLGSNLTVSPQSINGSIYITIPDYSTNCQQFFDGRVTPSGMGTKLEYSINILGGASESSSSNSLAVHRVDDWDYFQKSRLKVNKYQQRSRIFEDNLRNSMDRMIDKHNMDTIRRTMQMHEDTFRHQICELHRLYSVQKMLMEELKQEIKQNRIWDPMTTSNTDHIHIMHQSQLFNQQQGQTSHPGYNFHLHRLRDDPNSRERSGSCSGEYTMRISRGFDLERPAAAAEEDISTGVSTIDQDQTAGPSSNIALIKSNNNNMRSMDVYEEDSEEVELTLGIGCCSKSKKRSKPYMWRPHFGRSELVINKEKVLDSPSSFKSDRGDCSDPTTPMSSSSATVDQERKQPHWLFHGLKLK